MFLALVICGHTLPRLPAAFQASIRENLAGEGECKGMYYYDATHTRWLIDTVCQTSHVKPHNLTMGTQMDVLRHDLIWDTASNPGKKYCSTSYVDPKKHSMPVFIDNWSWFIKEEIMDHKKVEHWQTFNEHKLILNVWIHREPTQKYDTLVATGYSKEHLTHYSNIAVRVPWYKHWDIATHGCTDEHPLPRLPWSFVADFKHYSEFPKMFHEEGKFFFDRKQESMRTISKRGPYDVMQWSTISHFWSKFWWTIDTIPKVGDIQCVDDRVMKYCGMTMQIYPGKDTKFLGETTIGGEQVEKWQSRVDDYCHKSQIRYWYIKRTQEYGHYDILRAITLDDKLFMLYNRVIQKIDPAVFNPYSHHGCTIHSDEPLSQMQQFEADREEWYKSH